MSLDYILSSVSLPDKSLYLEMVLGIPGTQELSHLVPSVVAQQTHMLLAMQHLKKMPIQILASPILILLPASRFFLSL